MNVIDMLVKQSGKPTGVIGRIMLKVMNHVDSGLNKQMLNKINFPKAIGLEIGCGGGESANRLLLNRKLSKIIGLDVSIDAIKASNKKNANMVTDGKAEFIDGYVESLPFEDECFDVVYAIRSHYFWEDLEKGLREIHRVLNDGGNLYIFSELFKIKYHMDRFNNDESIRNLLIDIGFKNVEIENTRNTQCLYAIKI